MINIENIQVDIAGRGHITNSYVIYDEIIKKGILIDPGYDAKKIIDSINKIDVKIEYIVLTHAHGDHIGALKEMYEYTNSPIIIHENDYDMLTGKIDSYSKFQGIALQDLSKCEIVKVKDGFNFKVGELSFEIIHTPGHTSGSLCLLEKTSNSLFTGDTIFSDCYGRCDLATANFDDMVNSIKKIFNRFDDVIIYPGHGKSNRLSNSKKYIRMLLKMKGVTID